MSKELLVKAAEDALSKGKNVSCVLASRVQVIEGETVTVEDEKELEMTPEAIFVLAEFATKNITINGRKLDIGKDKKSKPSKTDTPSVLSADGGDGPSGGPKN